MLVLSFFSWWYGHGWQQVMRSFGPRLKEVANTFSVSQLSRTLFAPWRRIITYPGDSLAEKFHAWGDNVFSRAIGFVVRLIVLFAACLIMAAVTVFTLVEIVVWPLLPVAGPALIIVGLI